MEKVICGCRRGRAGADLISFDGSLKHRSERLHQFNDSSQFSLLARNDRSARQIRPLSAREHPRYVDLRMTQLEQLEGDRMRKTCASYIIWAIRLIPLASRSTCSCVLAIILTRSSQRTLKARVLTAGPSGLTA